MWVRQLRDLLSPRDCQAVCCLGNRLNLGSELVIASSRFHSWVRALGVDLQDLENSGQHALDRSNGGPAQCRNLRVGFALGNQLQGVDLALR